MSSIEKSKRDNREGQLASGTHCSGNCMHGHSLAATIAAVATGVWTLSGWRWPLARVAFRKISTRLRCRLPAWVRVCGRLQKRLYLAAGDSFACLQLAAVEIRVVSVCEMQNDVMVMCKMDCQMNMQNG